MGWQQQRSLPQFPGAQEATGNAAELQLGLSTNANTPRGLSL